MNIVVAIKHIPSIADELPVRGNNLDFDSVDFVLNEFDEQSIEQAVLVKEAAGGTVTVVGVDLIEELNNVLHLALAKGADKAVKITTDESGADSHMQAKWLADAIKDMSPDIIFAGVQASNDLDGQIGPMLAAYLDMPYIGGVSSVEVTGDTATVNKEFAGGVGAKYSCQTADGGGGASCIQAAALRADQQGEADRADRDDRGDQPIERWRKRGINDEADGSPRGYRPCRDDRRFVERSRRADCGVVEK
jgi:hypothetical protein